MAVALAGSPSTANGDNVTSLSWAHTPTGTPTSVHVNTGYWGSAVTVSSVTYGLEALAQEVTNSPGDGTTLYSHSRPAPLSGTQTVTVTFSGSAYGHACVLTVTGSDTADAVRTTANASGTSITPSTTIVSDADDLVFGMECSQGGPTVTVGAGQTQASNIVNSGNRAASSHEAGAASVTHDYTLSASHLWGIVAVSIKAAAAGGGVTYPKLERGTRGLHRGIHLGGYR